MFKVYTILLLLFLATITSLAQINPLEAEQKEIRMLRINGKCTEALPKIETLLKSDSMNAELYIDRARCLQNGDTPDAVAKDALYAVQLKPTDGRLYLEADGILFVIKRYDETVHLATEQIANGNTKFEAYGSRSRTRSLLGDYQGAIEDFIKGIEFRPLGGHVNMFGLFNTFEKAKDDPHIFEYYRFAFDSVQSTVQIQVKERRKSDPIGMTTDSLERSYTSILMGIAQNWISCSDEHNLLAEKKEALDKLVTIKPISLSFLTRSLHFKRTNEPEKAMKDDYSYHLWLITELTEQIAQRGRLQGDKNVRLLASIFFTRGDTYLYLGEEKKAVRDFQRAVELDPMKKRLVDEKLKFINKPNTP